MALVNCPYCGREGVSEYALWCPGCSKNVMEYFYRKRMPSAAEAAHMPYERMNKMSWRICPQCGMEVAYRQPECPECHRDVRRDPDPNPNGLSGLQYEWCPRCGNREVIRPPLQYYSTPSQLTTKSGIPPAPTQRCFFINLQCPKCGYTK